MATLSEALATAITHCEAGRAELAEGLCRRILAAEPNHADAWHLWGLIALQAGQGAAAIDRLRQAVRLADTQAIFHYHLGNALLTQGQAEEACACYRRAVQLQPDLAEAHNNLGAALEQCGDRPAAEDSYRQAIEQDPRYAQAHNNLGRALHARGDAAQAIACYRQALRLEPTLGQAHYNLGNALREAGQPAEAVACYRQALELMPFDTSVHNNLGAAYQDLEQFAEAAACYERALKLSPDHLQAQTNLGTALMSLGQLAAAIAWCRRAVQGNPDYVAGQVNLGNALQSQGEIDQAIACYRRALALQPDSAKIHSNLLWTLQYRPGITLAELGQARDEFDRLHIAPLKSLGRPSSISRNAERPLRLGFISADFRCHPVGSFYLRPIECLRLADVSLAGYFTGLNADEVTARFRAAVHTWRELPGSTDETLAEQIRADRIDILFDLTSHAAGNRLLVFGRKPAPIQVAWAGPTGVSAIDYLLADANLVPPDLEHGYREHVLRMPHAFACYRSPTEMPALTSLPALTRGHVTFGSPNNLAKITPQVIEAWAEILRRVPRSRLLLRFGGTTQDPGTQQRLQQLFAAAGIEAERLTWAGWMPYAERLAVYHQMDLVLDTFPFSGCTTTCEALWMGVPVIACPGETYMSRQSLSLLKTVGLADAVAEDQADYVDRAVGWATDLARLAAIRAGLRAQTAASPLCDGPRFAQDLMDVLRHVWRRWCADRQDLGP